MCYNIAMAHDPGLHGTLAIRVRYNECDPMGVAHHTIYPVWFEMGRTELLRASCSQQTGVISYRDLEQQGFLLAVVKLEVKYKSPARYDDQVTLHTTMTNAGHVKIDHTYTLYRETTLLATGSTTLACLDRAGRPQALPALLRGAD
jgi:acyl-CoA thioester hydrolase